MSRKSGTGGYKELITLVPGFKSDKDEDWLIYLSIEKQSFIKRQRAKFLLLNEHVDTLATTYQLQLDQNKNSDDSVKQKIKADYEEQRKRFLDKRQRAAKAVFAQIEAYKKEALENRASALREMSDALRKKPRYEDSHMEVEYVTDDYLPSVPTPSTSSAASKGAPTIANKPPLPLNPATERTGPPAIDPLIKDCDQTEAKCLNELRTLITKYNCRDRVLKAIQSYRSRSKSLKALEAFTASLRLFRAEPAHMNGRERNNHH